MIPAQVPASLLNPSVEIAGITSIEGDGLGFIAAEGSVSPSHATIRKTFQAVAPIDVTFRVNDEGGSPIVFTVYDSYLYNLTFEKWEGFRHQLGYKDAAGNFHLSNAMDGLSFATDDLSIDQFYSLGFGRHDFGSTGDTLDWSQGTIQFPQRTLFLIAIHVPASNAAMPSFAMRDGGYEFTLRELPIVTWRSIPDAIVPEPRAAVSFAVGLLSLTLRALIRGHRPRRSRSAG